MAQYTETVSVVVIISPLSTTCSYWLHSTYTCSSGRSMEKMLLASTLKLCVQPVFGLTMVPSQFLLALTNSCTRTQPCEGTSGWYLNPLPMNESQNSLPCVVTSCAWNSGMRMPMRHKVKIMRFRFFME